MRSRRLFLRILAIIIGLIFLVWSSFYGLHCRLPLEGSPPILLATQTDDHLQRTFLKAIEKAQQSITLIAYSFSDEKLFLTLKKKQEEGICITIIYDPTTNPKNLLGNSVPQKMHGLMHRKILIIDKEEVWIGSANFTQESLKIHDNLVIACRSKELAETILANNQHHHFTIGGQMAEFWSFPESNEEGFSRLLGLLSEAETSIQVGMFTLTHPSLSKALIDAAKRGVHVEVVLDRAQSVNTNKKVLEGWKKTPIHVRLNRGNEIFHHKFVLIDNKILISGSANWTKSAFKRNSDCFLVLHNLSERQRKKMTRLWHIIRATSDKEFLGHTHPQRNPVDLKSWHGSHRSPEAGQNPGKGEKSDRLLATPPQYPLYFGRLHVSHILHGV